MDNNYYKEMEGAIAIIGMSGAFSEAEDINSFWKNIKEGKECIRDLSDVELDEAGISSDLYNSPNYVKRSASLKEAKMFDPAFFGYTPSDANVMDPQHRLFLEHSWKCMEDGCYDPEEYDGLIGVYAGCSQNDYLIKNLVNSNTRIDSLEAFQLMLGNDKDYLSTRVSYKLNLKGPSMTIQTACSTSATAIQQACLSLINYQCDMALAGGSSVNVPHDGGYEYKDGLIFSPDGHCRSFDEKANGTVFGDGVGVILLKRLEDALEDKDHIYALIRGAAINNDGSEKVSYTAPSVKAQAEVIATAIALAEVPTESIGYIEAHGTGTLLGDPIEVAALTDAFRMNTKGKDFCVLGSVKPNIGHLDAAAGVASIIKTVKILQEGIYPPQVNFSSPNPALELETSPFKINKDLKKWERGAEPRRAGVSSLGVGGTNVHIVLEEYIPPVQSISENNEVNILPLSAKSPESLKQMKANLVSYLKDNSNKLSDASYTLLNYRRHFPYRDTLISITGDQDELNSFINTPPATTQATTAPVVFLFSGQGSQYPNMGRQLYEEIPFIREIMDRCFSYLKEEENLALKEIMYPPQGDEAKSQKLLQETSNTQPALFILEYALSKYLQEFDIKPDYLIGHSLGEYTAACLAGFFTLEEALLVVAERGKIMQSAPKGSMLSVALGEEDLKSYLEGKEELQIAVINSPGRCVVSGTYNAIEKLKNSLDEKDIPHSLLKTSHAYHSFMMDSVLDDFREVVEKVNFKAPSLPLLSNTTGDFLKTEDINQRDYWVNQIKSTVRFSNCISSVLAQSKSARFIEIGPGNTLCSLAKMNPEITNDNVILPMIKGPKQQAQDKRFLFNNLSKLWNSGYDVNWGPITGKKEYHKISLPTYAFNHKEYWITQTLPKNTNKIEQNNSLNEHYTSPNSFHKSPKDKLKEIWQQTFGISEIKDESDFFELGGDSILAVRLCDTLNKTFNKSISLGKLFAAKTFFEQLQLIEDSVSDSESATLIRLSKKQNESVPTLFCILGINIYQHLADALDNTYNVYGVFLPQEQELLMNQKELPSLQEMATMYRNMVKKTQPNGPYYIAGLSFGGILAYELARQLYNEGEEIKLLSIFDSKLPKEITKFKRITLHLRTLRLGNISLSIRKVKRRLISTLSKMIGVSMAPKLEKTADEDLIDMRQAIYMKVAKKYTINMPSFDGPATVFRALDSDPFEKLLYNDDLGWKEYVHGNLSLHNIHGDHLSILHEENVEEIASVLRQELAR
ncbi:MAG: beta-ketoacyl synthase N-terminal-like domain-containing protein [Spirochaetales bacterium]|nr:beta-ketoacyl synthase N-terminal-like domain-containing protein [Spirochaetales bacterium]